MDLFNNEIVAYYLSNKKGNPDAYHIAMSMLIEQKVHRPWNDPSFRPRFRVLL